MCDSAWSAKQIWNWLKSSYRYCLEDIDKIDDYDDHDDNEHDDENNFNTAAAVAAADDDDIVNDNGDVDDNHYHKKRNENDGNRILSKYGSHQNIMTVSLPGGTILEEDR